MSPRVWLITGANSGLGLSLARHVLAQKDIVIAAVRNIAKIPDSINAATPLALDLNASDADIKKAGEKALAVHGRIDVLVNNAGYSLTGPIEELDPADLRAQYQTHIFGPVSLMQSLLPAFRAQKSGHILNISSIAALAGGPGFGAYNSSKLALEGLSEAMATEVAKFNIRVLIVEPGYFPTNFLATAKATDVPSERATGAYTDPAQGFGAPSRYHPIHVQQKQIGDPAKAAARIFEVVAQSGPASLKPHWVRVPLGPDSGKRLLAKIELLKANVVGTEPIWNSTDVDPETFEKLYAH